MRKRFKQLLAQKNSEQYVVRGDEIGRSGHTEVQGNVDSTIEDHRQLLREDQNCVEKIMEVDDLDSSNDANCQCQFCEPGKCTAKNNRIIKQIFG